MRERKEMTTPLGRVLGLGSARSGTLDFFHDRVRALVLFFLTPYMIVLGVWLFGRPRDYVVDALGSLWVAAPLGLYLVLTLLHMRLGMQTIIEDYIHAPGYKVTLTFLNTVFCFGLAAGSFVALLSILARHSYG